MTRRPKVSFLDVTINRRLTEEQKIALAAGLFDTIVRVSGHCAACTADVLALMVGMHAKALNNHEDITSEEEGEIQEYFEKCLDLFNEKTPEPVATMVMAALLGTLGHSPEEDEEPSRPRGTSPIVH